MRLLLARLWTLGLYACLRLGRRLARTWPADAPSNCYLWALQQQARGGGALRLVDSRYGPWLHCEWVTPSGARLEFLPERPKASFRSLRWGMPPLMFPGRVRMARSLLQPRVDGRSCPPSFPPPTR